MRPSIWPALLFHYWTNQYLHFSPQKYPGVLFENRVALNLMDYHHTFPLLMLFDGYLFTSLTQKKNFPGLSNTFPGQGCWLSASALQPRSSGIKDALFGATPVGFALSRELATISHSVAELDNSAHQALNCHGLDCRAKPRRSKGRAREKLRNQVLRARNQVLRAPLQQDWRRKGQRNRRQEFVRLLWLRHLASDRNHQVGPIITIFKSRNWKGVLAQSEVMDGFATLHI